MNREDLLKKCVDRGVADETSIGTVSHLFYVYLLSALQKGQRVEIPAFGTFGTRVVGVKRARRMPFFEPEQELADKVNERYRDMKYLVVGKYDLIPAFGEEEYKGKEAPYDAGVDQVGKESILDTHRDVTIEEYEKNLAAAKVPTPTKEKKLMPKLNLKDEGMEEEMQPVEPEGMGEPTPPTPRLRETATEGRGPSPLLQVVLAVLILGILTVALNYFGVIHLWGKKTPAVTEIIPEPVVTAPPETARVETPTPTPTPLPIPEKPKPTIPSGSGRYTVQVSAWMTQAKADEEAGKLSAAGYSAFVEGAVISGETWHRVRVGRYATEKEAAAAAAQLQQMLENGIWVARVSSR